MENNHPVNELMAETIRRIREAVDANTVVGEPIVAGEITLVPVSKISFGFGTGGSEFGGKAPNPLGENPVGGGGGAGAMIARAIRAARALYPPDTLVWTSTLNAQSFAMCSKLLLRGEGGIKETELLSVCLL